MPQRGRFPNPAFGDTLPLGIAVPESGVWKTSPGCNLGKTMNPTDARHDAVSPRAGWGSLIVFVAACLLIGSLGATSTASSVDSWYPGLTKPSWNPPNSIFAPVWTALFIMMGVSVWLVWRRRHGIETRPAMMLFGAQLVLNALWSALFFGMQRPGWAAIEIVLLWLVIAATIAVFARISKPAAWLLAPYLAWVSFATALNFAIWRLNA